MMADKVIRYYSKWFSTSRTGEGLLKIGHSGQHVANIACALQKLRYRPPSSSEFTTELAEEVKRFQRDAGNQNIDGRVGPGTRSMLVHRLLESSGSQFFRNELKPTFPTFFQVFLSYARCDSKKVDALDQWLRDHGIAVARDIRDFEAGQSLKEEISSTIYESDKVVAVVTFDSKNRDWPMFETFVAAEVERLRNDKCLIYLLLDDTEAPKYDAERINVLGTGKPLREIGEMILHSVLGSGASPMSYPYDENKPL